MGKYRKPRPKLGSYKAECAVSGMVVNAEELVQRWDGQWVLPEDCDERHPQEYEVYTSAPAIPPWTRKPHE